MGLFGRDDRTDGNKPAPAEPKNRQRPTPPAGSSITLIAETAHVEGEIKGAGEVRIEGTVKGKLDCTAAVVIAEGGRVEAELRAETVTVAGTVNGDIYGTQKIELTPTARVEGDLNSPRILIREGATFEGQVLMTAKRSPKPAEKEKDPAKPSEPDTEQ
jgi:cytoskeletal protein CcmA (bactofilin family)